MVQDCWAPSRYVGDLGCSDDRDSEEDVDRKLGPRVDSRDFRSRYINRLTASKVWVPPSQRPAKHQTVFIFDWDDTLLCTSWLQDHCDMKLDPTTTSQLASIEKHALKMLTLAMSLGQTFIVTNADAGWVEHSAASWAPNLSSALSQVQIVSARNEYEDAYPYDINKWKVEAFLELQRNLPQPQVTNLIALGDSEFEMVAAQKMRAKFEHALLKTVKFQAKPSPWVMLKQMQLVSRNLGKIASSAKNMRILLERR
mmetsp:Transcript_73569/g.206561  ORF Transcript_73569/g.206561 Transcript_73569/m.206561 type:complete len:255 (+) Transcript_73569:98-862(+)